MSLVVTLTDKGTTVDEMRETTDVLTELGVVPKLVATLLKIMVADVLEIANDD